LILAIFSGRQEKRGRKQEVWSVWEVPAWGVRSRRKDRWQEAGGSYAGGVGTVVSVGSSPQAWG